VNYLGLVVLHTGDKVKFDSFFSNSTNSTESNMFNFGNNVDRDKLWNSTSSPVCTDERQSRHNVTRG